jgi:ferredoxin-NADP reductase
VSATVACTVAGRITRAPGVESVRLLPETPFPFLAGQYVQVLLDPAHPADRELNKYLSLSAPPGRPYLEVTKKLSASAFSARLRALAPGDRVGLRGPFGDCVLRPEDRRVAFIAGGIGITPIVAMVEHAVTARPGLPMHLFYANRTAEEFAFRDELERLAGANPGLELHLFVTSGAAPDPRLSPGRVTPEALRAAVADPAGWTWFVFGPPPMVAAMREACVAIGVPGEGIRTEGFLGY